MTYGPLDLLHEFVQAVIGMAVVSLAVIGAMTVLNLVVSAQWGKK